MHKYLNPKNYLRYFLNRSIRFASIPFQSLEKNLVHKYGEQSSKKYPPVFIIGAPRTGSTILYEYMTNYLNVIYINNLMCKFHRILYLASIVSRIIFKDKQHNIFTSQQGATIGWNAPSECGEFWYRWFPRDRHFVDFNELDDIQMREIRNVIIAIVNRHGKPIVFKNMNCGQRLRVIKDIFPEALFIYCKRDPLYVAESIIKTREKVYDDRTKWWSIMPKQYNDLIKLDYPEQVVKQIYYIQNQIEQDLNLFGLEKALEVWYEDFYSSPRETIEKIINFLAINKVKVGYKSEIRGDNILPFNRNKKTIDDQTFYQLKEIICSLDW